MHRVLIIGSAAGIFGPAASLFALLAGSFYGGVSGLLVGTCAAQLSTFTQHVDQMLGITRHEGGRELAQIGAIKA